MDQVATIPVTVIGGYLGAGKTTLLNHVLRNNADVRFAVLVNDFGQINIDAELIESQDGDTLNLANGCICCSLSAGFTAAMLSIRDRPAPPDWVIIEASGVSDPFVVAQYAHLVGFRLDGVIVVADAETVRRRANDKYVGRFVRQQLRSADLVLLNKTDLVSTDELVQVRQWLRAMVEDVRVIEAIEARVPLELLFDQRDPTIDAVGHDYGIAIEHQHSESYSSWSFECDDPIDGSRFRALTSRLPEAVVRGKGVLSLEEDTSTRFLFQLVGRRSTLARGEPWGDLVPMTRLVFIALPGTDHIPAVEHLLSELRPTADAHSKSKEPQ